MAVNGVVASKRSWRRRTDADAAARRQGARREAHRPPGRRRRDGEARSRSGRVTGLGTSPVPIWSDADNHFFGVSFGLAWLPEAYAGEQTEDRRRADEGAGRAGAGLRKSLLNDAARARWPSTACGSSTPTRRSSWPTRRWSSTRARSSRSARATSITRAGQARRSSTARGKTLVPGLWDCHMHVGDDYTGAAGAVDGRHVGPRSGQRRLRDDGSARRARRRASCCSRTSIRRRSSTARGRTPRRWRTSPPARPKRSRSSTRPRPTVSSA